MPKIAEGDANKVWIVPTEIGKALEGLGSTMNDLPASRRRSRARARGSTWAPEPRGQPRSDAGQDERPSRRRSPTAEQRRNAAVEAAIADGGAARTNPGRARTGRGRRDRPTRRRGASPRRDPGSRSVAILLAGVAAGTINTVVGSGTLITFPTLLAFGVPPVTANVSNTVGLVPGSVSGADRLPPGAVRPAGARAAPGRRLADRRPGRRAAAAGAARAAPSRRSCRR